MLNTKHQKSGPELDAGYRELLAYLGNGEEESARGYLLARAKLLTYFEARGITPAEDHADEVLHRAAAKFAAGEKIEDIGRYLYGIARFVRLESFREPRHESIDAANTDNDERGARSPASLIAQPDRVDDSEDVRHACLGECLRALDADKRSLLLEYYDTDEPGGGHIGHRKALADRLGKKPGALQKQVCLLRQKLASCTKDCVARELGDAAVTKGKEIFA